MIGACNLCTLDAETEDPWASWLARLSGLSELKTQGETLPQ